MKGVGTGRLAVGGSWRLHGGAICSRWSPVSSRSLRGMEGASSFDSSSSSSSATTTTTTTTCCARCVRACERARVPGVEVVVVMVSPSAGTIAKGEGGEVRIGLYFPYFLFLIPFIFLLFFFAVGVRCSVCFLLFFLFFLSFFFLFFLFFLEAATSEQDPCPGYRAVGCGLRPMGEALSKTSSVEVLVRRDTCIARNTGQLMARPSPPPRKEEDLPRRAGHHHPSGIVFHPINFASSLIFLPVCFKKERSSRYM